MSNATQGSQNSGEQRRRRSRGGQNRRNNNNRDRRSGDRDQQKSPARAEEFRPQAPRGPRKYSAPKLTLWQKILKAVGLYKEPVRPPRPERKPDVVKSSDGKIREPRVKSNTRNARKDGGDTRSAPDGERAPRKRRERDENGPRENTRGRDNNRSRGGDRNSVECARVYLGNLSYDVSESDLQELFKGVGGVRNVEVVYNRNTHRSKGYAFVEMLHVDEAKRAVEVLHDQPFMGRKMTVSGAKSKGQDDREDKDEQEERKPAVVAEPPAVTVAAPVESAPVAEEVIPSEIVAEEPAPGAEASSEEQEKKSVE